MSFCRAAKSSERTRRARQTCARCFRRMSRLKGTSVSVSPEGAPSSFKTGWYSVVNGEAVWQDERTGGTYRGDSNRAYFGDAQIWIRKRRAYRLRLAEFTNDFRVVELHCCTGKRLDDFLCLLRGLDGAV
jgi:hypothetical protein